ncbi:unnamed protein product [Pylaiella littoralis]
MINHTACCALLFITGIFWRTDAFIPVAPRLVPQALSRDSNHRHYHVQQRTDTIRRQNSDARRHTRGEQRLDTIDTIHSSSVGGHHDHHHHQQQQQQEPAASATGFAASDQWEEEQEELVLREFRIAVVSEGTTSPHLDPAVYERRVRAECLREGGETATVVRWHVSRVDEETGHAHVEAVFLVSSASAADAATA